MALAGLLLSIASCGGGGGGGTGPSADAPVVSGLQVRALDPETPNRTVRYIAAFNVTDRNGDVVNGQCEVLLNGLSIGRVPLVPVPGLDPNVTEGTVACAFSVRATAPQQINGIVRIFDRAGNPSSDLAFVLGIRAEVPSGARPESGKGAVEGRMESATLGR